MGQTGGVEAKKAAFFIITHASMKAYFIYFFFYFGKSTTWICVYGKSHKKKSP